MRICFNSVLFVLLALALPGCKRNPDPIAKKPDNAPKAEAPAQTVDVKPKEAVPSEQDRLLEKAKALPPGKVHIELLRSAPAGAAGERAEYEWALLTRFPPPAENVPKEGEKQASPFQPVKWIVVRMTMTATIEKVLEKDAKGQRMVDVRLLCSEMNDRGTSEFGGQLITTKNLTLAFNSTGGFPAMLMGQFALGKGENPHGFAAKMAPLDELVVPRAKSARTVDLPYSLELARCGDESIAVAVVFLDTK